MDSNDLIDNGLKCSLMDGNGNPNLYLSHEKEKELILRIENISEHEIQLGSAYNGVITLELVNGKLNYSQPSVLDHQWKPKITSDKYDWVYKITFRLEEKIILDNYNKSIELPIQYSLMESSFGSDEKLEVRLTIEDILIVIPWDSHRVRKAEQQCMLTCIREQVAQQPIAATLIGTSSLLNDGETENDIHLRLVNISDYPVNFLPPFLYPELDGSDKLIETQSTIEFFFPVSSNEETVDCLCTGTEIKDAKLRVFTSHEPEKITEVKPSSDDKATNQSNSEHAPLFERQSTGDSEGETGKVILKPNYNNIKGLKPREALDFVFQGIKTNFSSGFVQLRVRLDGVVRYGAIEVAVPLEKSPFVYEKNNARLTLDASNLGSKTGLLVQGNGGDVLNIQSEKVGLKINDDKFTIYPTNNENTPLIEAQEAEVKSKKLISEEIHTTTLFFNNNEINLTTIVNDIGNIQNTIKEQSSTYNKIEGKEKENCKDDNKSIFCQMESLLKRVDALEKKPHTLENYIQPLSLAASIPAGFISAIKNESGDYVPQRVGTKSGIFKDYKSINKDIESLLKENSAQVNPELQSAFIYHNEKKDPSYFIYIQAKNTLTSYYYSEESAESTSSTSYFNFRFIVENLDEVKLSYDKKFGVKAMPPGKICSTGDNKLYLISFNDVKEVKLDWEKDGLIITNEGNSPVSIEKFFNLRTDDLERKMNSYYERTLYYNADSIYKTNPNSAFNDWHFIRNEELTIRYIDSKVGVNYDKSKTISYNDKYPFLGIKKFIVCPLFSNNNKDPDLLFIDKYALNND